MKFVFKLFILHLLSCWERQNHLLKPRATDPGFASVISLWKSEFRHKVQLWGSPALWDKSGAHQRLGRNFNLLYPFTRVQNCGSHGQGWDGRSCCSAGSCTGTKDARNITPAPLNCSVFFHHKTKEDHSESCWYCTLRLLAGEKKNKIEGFVLFPSWNIVMGLMISLPSSVEILHQEAQHKPLSWWNERNNWICVKKS